MPPLLRRAVHGRHAHGKRWGVAEEGEDIDVLELPFHEALAMVDDGRIADAKTILLLQWAALRGLFVLGGG